MTHDANDTRLFRASDSSGGLTPAATGNARFGDYELLEEIGRGGMGVVHKARQLSLGRVVAVKRLPFSATTNPDYVKRFRVEASAAASLQHPNIVAIHEVGVHQGQHYFAMDYIEGQSLARVVAAGPLPVHRAARYVKIVAEAIEYAHQRGILHRDLKPSNILLDPFDQPRVTDFGLAKKLEGDSSLTLSGQVLGSPNYMPPEQADAGRGNVGRPSDVYALGATLYHLVTGRAPFVAATVAETLRQLQTEEPVSPQLLNPAVPRDLATICLKCLEKEPEKRYATAQSLADELGRFLNAEPIQARPVGWVGKTGRWCRRKPALAAALAGLLAVFVAGLAGVIWQWRRAETSATNERREHDVAQGRLYAAQMKLAHAALKAGKPGGAMELLQAWRPAPDRPDLRGFDWRFLYRLCRSSQSEVLSTNASGFNSVDFSPDGRLIAFGSSDGMVELFDARIRQRVKRWPAHEGPVDDLAFDPTQPNRLATTSGDDGLLKLWDTARAQLLCSTNSSKGLWANVGFSPDGKYLAAGATNAGSLNLWEIQPLPSGAVPRLLLKTNLGFGGALAFSPDGRTLALCNQNASFANVGLYDLLNAALRVLPLAHGDFLHCVAFSPDGERLATGAADERVFVWDLAGQKVVAEYASDVILVTSLVFALDGHSVFVSGWDQNLRSWRFSEPARTNLWRGHSAGVNALARSPDGHSLASAGRDGTARLWNLRAAPAEAQPAPREISAPSSSPEEGSELLRMRSSVSGIAVSPISDHIAIVTQDRLVLLDLATGRELAGVRATNLFQTGRRHFRSVAFSPDGERLAVGSKDGQVALLNASHLHLVRGPIPVHTAMINELAFGLGGAVLAAAGGFGGGVKLLDVASGQVLHAIPPAEGILPTTALAVSRDGRRLAAAGPGRSVQIWDIAARRVVQRCPLKVRFLHTVAFSPDGQRLAIADEQGAIFLWDLNESPAVRRFVGGHSGPATTLAFSPDGRTLASGSMDHTIRLWHPDIDQEIAVLEGHRAWIWAAAFAEQGHALVSGSRDGTVRIWRGESFADSAAKEAERER